MSETDLSFTVGNITMAVSDTDGVVDYMNSEHKDNMDTPVDDLHADTLNDILTDLFQQLLMKLQKLPSEVQQIALAEMLKGKSASCCPACTQTTRLVWSCWSL